MNNNTVLMYEDNIRICLLSGLKIPSSNVKTGNKLQTYIILKNASPLDAVKSGEDVLICGNSTSTLATATASLAGGSACYVGVWKQRCVSCPLFAG